MKKLNFTRHLQHQVATRSVYQNTTCTYQLCSVSQCKVINDKQHTLQTVQECRPVKLLTVMLKRIITRL